YWRCVSKSASRRTADRRAAVAFLAANQLKPTPEPHHENRVRFPRVTRRRIRDQMRGHYSRGSAWAGRRVRVVTEPQGRFGRHPVKRVLEDQHQGQHGRGERADVAQVSRAETRRGNRRYFQAPRGRGRWLSQRTEREDSRPENAGGFGEQDREADHGE